MQTRANNNIQTAIEENINKKELSISMVLRFVVRKCWSIT